MDFNEWRREYPDGTRILWHDNLLSKTWLPGSITGTREFYGEMVLQFRLDSDPPRTKLPHLLSIKHRDLLRKFKHTDLKDEDVKKLWESGEAVIKQERQ